MVCNVVEHRCFYFYSGNHNIYHVPFAWISSLLLIRCEKMADCDDEHVNRIGDLPMNVIVSILQRLPFQDLVKTSVLARAWRYMWSSTPRREFRDDFFEKCNHLGYLETSGIITEALLLHTSPHTRLCCHPSSALSYQIRMPQQVDSVFVEERG